MGGRFLILAIRGDREKTAMSIEVNKPGLLTIPQDRGRTGYAHLGVGRAGAFDMPAFRLANALSGRYDVGVILMRQLLPTRLYPGRERVEVHVENTGDRPIQVGSHYHFAETNAALRFDRAAARGMRLNIASGTAVRFEPGQQRTVELVDFAGSREVFGFRGLVQGKL